MKKNISIAVDGPAGSGKSTVCKMVADRLGLYHLDTGAMYRALGYAAIRNGVSHKDLDAVLRLIENTEIKVSFDEEKKQHVHVNGEDVTDKIRTGEIAQAASDFGTVERVRAHMVKLQREFAAGNPVILDGRDICMYVLPDADVKIFLTATPEERAKRRFLDFKQKGIRQDATLEDIAEELKTRDAQDSSRKASPLAVAEDAYVLDTTNMTAEEACNKIIAMAEEK